MIDYKMVVARFDEDISWCKKYDTIIYNKGSDAIPGAIKLQNVGREAHTYLHHIINNYDNLNDLTIFVQGNPFVHDIDLNKLFDVEPLGYNTTLQDLSNNRWGLLNSNHENFVIREWKDNISNIKNYTLKQWWETTTNEPYIRSPKIFWSAIFSVKKEHILKRTLESYTSLYQTLLHNKTPIEAHFCERTWFNILNLPL